MADASSSVKLKGKESFAVKPDTLTPEEKKYFITRNLEVSNVPFTSLTYVPRDSMLALYKICIGLYGLAVGLGLG